MQGRLAQPVKFAFAFHFKGAKLSSVFVKFRKLDELNGSAAVGLQKHLSYEESA